ENDITRLRERISDAQSAVARDTDDITRERLVGDLAVLRHEHHRIVDVESLARGGLQRHAALEAAGGDTEEADAVTVLGVHVRLDLEDEAADVFAPRRDFRFHALHRRAERPWRRRIGAETGEQLEHPETAQRRAEIDRRQMAFAERLEIKPRQALAREFGGFFKLGAHVIAHVMQEAVAAALLPLFDGEA